MSASALISRFCKRGHPRTLETTFERKSYQNGKLYIVRECRLCHSMRNIKNAGHGDKTGRKNNSKWVRFLEAHQ